MSPRLNGTFNLCRYHIDTSKSIDGRHQLVVPFHPHIRRTAEKSRKWAQRPHCFFLLELWDIGVGGPNSSNSTVPSTWDYHLVDGLPGQEAI